MRNGIPGIAGILVAASLASGQPGIPSSPPALLGKPQAIVDSWQPTSAPAPVGNDWGQADGTAVQRDQPTAPATASHSEGWGPSQPTTDNPILPVSFHDELTTPSPSVVRGQGPDPFVASPNCSTCGWLEVDYLLWWTKQGTLSAPLVTTGPIAQQTTVNSGSLDYGPASGARIDGGVWLDPEHWLGVARAPFCWLRWGPARPLRRTPWAFRP